MSLDHHNLFHRSTVFDQLNFFQSLLDSRDLSADQASALLHTIRIELEAPQVNRSTAYRRYGQVMASLQREMPELYDQIVNAWKTKRGIAEMEETPHARLVRAQIGTRSKSAQEQSDDFWQEENPVDEKPTGEIHAVAHANNSKTEPAIEVGEGAAEVAEEEHGEAEEHEEEEPEEEKEEERENEEKREETEEGQEEKEEFEDENEKEEKEEEAEEEPEEKEDEETEEEESEEVVKEESEEAETKTEQEESEPEDASEEHESEAEQAETESERSESEAEAPEESDHMISEAAEAAAESEHVSMEIEPEEIETEGEEEPPMEAGE